MLKLQISMYPWVVIGISGVTCGGKTSLTFQLRDLLSEYFCSQKRTVSISTISQDDFFLKPDDPRHEYIPTLGHNNWELPSAVDLNRMYEQALGVIYGKGTSEAETNFKAEADNISQCSHPKICLKGILLIEGFLVLNHKPTRSLCHLGYYLVLSRAVCEMRRSYRSYDPPDVPGYFEQCVWPEHLCRREEIVGKGKLVDQSDPLSVNELELSLEEENKALKEGKLVVNECINANPEVELSSFTHKKQTPLVVNQPIQKPVEKVTEFRVGNEWTKTSQMLEGDNRCSNSDNLWMRIDGDVQPLEGFGKAGLGMVNGIRVLNGGVISNEEIAKLVLKDILAEMARLNFE